ncbi:hypothetical protein DJICPGNB_05335 [Escherichia coli]|nr:hypothetical protein DJICPGNB_05335 [Escherichia coli]
MAELKDVVVWVKNVDHQLRHEADSDVIKMPVAEKRSKRKVAAFFWQNRAMT